MPAQYNTAHKQEQYSQQGTWQNDMQQATQYKGKQANTARKQTETKPHNKR
jgi:hypothetical protein